MNADELKSSYNKMIKSGLLVEVVNSDGVNTMVTSKGYEVWQTLNIFISNNGSKPVEEKPKKTGQEKMDGVIKTVVQVGAGISQLMQGLGSMAGEPVKMDMANAGIGFGQEKPKAKTYKKKKTRSKKQ
jgi:hypothetical protein